MEPQLSPTPPENYMADTNIAATLPNTFPKWDKTKRLMHTYAIEAWDKKVRTRGNASAGLKKGLINEQRTYTSCNSKKH
jgi:hypothetical protein